MQSVLAFGDSLTWGSRPDISGRHGFDDRWPNVLAAGLNGVDVISEGLRGRTTCFNQPASPAEMNGGALLPSILHTHAPLDGVIVMLGTNDMFWGVAPTQAAYGLARLVEIIRHHAWRCEQAHTPEVMLIAPPVMVESTQGDVTAEMIDASSRYPALVEGQANQLGCAFFDAGSVAQTSPVDGLHLDAENTRKIGVALVPLVGPWLS